MKILIVEDNEIKRNLIFKAIKDKYEEIAIEMSNNIMDAKKNLQKNFYDILILDLNLPCFEDEECKDESGILLFKEINKSDLYNKPAEIIIMTAYNDLKNKYEDEIQKGLFNIIKFNSSEQEWRDMLISKLKYIQEYKKERGLEENNEKLLFISHSSEDIEYVKVFVKLLEDMGFTSRKELFCSSLSGYNIPIGENIYDYLKKQFNKELYVVCLLSENYYLSPACMNEMGATWVKSKKCKAILVPGFKYSQLRGAIDASRVWFNLDEKDRISEFKEELESEFNLNEIEVSKWIRKLDEYLTSISDVNKNKYKKNIERVILEEIIDEGNENSIKIFLRFINKSNQTQKCKNIILKIKDERGNIITVNMGLNILNQFIFYKHENRRETIIIDKKNIKELNNFNINNWQIESIEDSWTSSF